MSRQRIGLIAGLGRLPVLTAQGILASGAELAVVGFRGHADPSLREMTPQFAWTGLARPGAWIRRFRRWGVTQAVMVGGVRKAEIYNPWRLVQYVPDWRAMRIWYFKLRHDHRDNAVLLALADELAGEGINLMSSVEYCQEHLAGEGMMTRTAPSAEAAADAEFGFRIARSSARLDIGQALAVKERDIIAVEAMEGTDAMIERAGQLCRRGGWTLVKVARPEQDMRFDVPAVGVNTIEQLHKCRGVCLVVEAGKTLILDKPQTLALADKYGIAVVGMKG